MSPGRDPNERKGSRMMASARGSLCAHRLPFRPLLPRFNPFREPRQVGPGSDEQRRRERLMRPLVPVLAGVEAECDPGPFGEQVATVAGDLAQLRTGASTSSGFRLA
jgi:hypothetical protein